MTNTYITDALRNAVKERYSSEGSMLISKEFGVPRGPINQLAMRLGIRANPKTWNRIRCELSEARCDRKYFETWTPSSAYIRGYIWADGNLDERKSGSVVLRFSCLSSDIEILNFIRSELKVETALLLDHREGRNDCSYFSICDQIMVEPLLSHGLEPRKSFKDLPFPYVPRDYLGDFFRGYFDGDGSAYNVKGRDSVRVCYVGTPKFVVGMRDSISSRLDVKANRAGPSSTPTCWSTGWYSIKDVEKLYKWMYYSGHPFSLARKRTKIETYLKGRGLI